MQASLFSITFWKGTLTVALGIASAATAFFTGATGAATIGTLAWSAAVTVLKITLGATVAVLSMLIGGLLLVGGAVLLFYFGLVPLWNWLKKITTGIYSEVVPALEVLKDAFKMGDMETAVKIAWETIKYLYDIGFEYIKVKTTKWKAFFFQSMNEMTGMFEKQAEAAKREEKDVFENLKLYQEKRRNEYKKTIGELQKVTDAKKMKAAADEKERIRNEENQRRLQKQAREQINLMQQIQGGIAKIGVNPNTEMMKSVRGVTSGLAVKFTNGGVFDIWNPIKEILKNTEKNTFNTVEAINNLDLDFAVLE